MKNPRYNRLLALLTFLFSLNYCLGQKDKTPVFDINPVKIPRITIPVKTGKFESNEVKNAVKDYEGVAKPGQLSNSLLAGLQKKGHSPTAILATIRQFKLKKFTGISTISNSEIAEDAQLMLKAMPALTSAEMITAIRDLYTVNAIALFNIALLTSQDSVQRVNQSRTFYYKCDCKIRLANQVSSSKPFRKSLTQTDLSSPYYKKLYPWECFDYWNTGLRSVLLAETTLNEFLRMMRASEYPLYGGMSASDLTAPSVNFSIIMGGTTAESLAELMECATLAYLSPVTNDCVMEIPSFTSMPLEYNNDYSGTCKHVSINKTRFYLKDVFTALKGSGFSAATMAAAAKIRFNPPDDDLKQRIIASFDPAVFSAAEILQASNILNSN